MLQLTAQNVENIFLDCLFKENEPTDGYTLAQGIMTNVGFHPERLKSHRNEIAQLFSQLPDEFMHDKGKGMSFLNACNTKDDVQWGEHQDMEQLFLLGLASNLVTQPFPREQWHMLPGNVPYYVVDISSELVS